MAADEPPYLTIGTDVSAKYKGAFCEAKIKKVNRVVKCKVTFKNSLGTFMLTDDQVKGPLKIGADIDAKHPEKSQFLEAVVNKVQDYSQYTVVFDDGDETTLRRTSLCLKSGRHFAESPTLDQFPLTNPEHFGTPVIGSSKFKRKRRSTMNSSVDYESSEDESVPRKLKAIRGKEQNPDLGKVVCVDYGDRRKKDNWYPGLIVPHPSQSTIKITKDEHLIRSFKDGKYYQVPKRDIREFSKEAVQKVENNSLRTAVEKAVNYLEKDELPPNWDKALFASLELQSGDDDSQDSDSDTSDDEPSEEKDRFVAQLYKFMDERGTPINKAPSVSNRDLNLYKLFKIMHKLGGYNKVTNKNKWKGVYLKMGLPQSNVNGPNQIRSAYKRFLQSFEDFYRKLGCTMVSNSRSTRGRHRSDRNFIVTRTREKETASPKSRAVKDLKEKQIPVEKKTEEKIKQPEKKETKPVDPPKVEEKSVRTPDKKRVEKRDESAEKQKKDEKPRLVRSQSFTKEKKDTKPEKARTREDARKEKNESPEKKGTRSSLKIDQKEKEEPPKEKKEKPPVVKDKKEEKTLVKEEKVSKIIKKEDKLIRKPTREKKLDEKPVKEKREIPPREIKSIKDSKLEALPIEEKVPIKVKKEEKVVEDKSPRRKLERISKEIGKESKDTELKEDKTPKLEVEPSPPGGKDKIKGSKPKEKKDELSGDEADLDEADEKSVCSQDGFERKSPGLRFRGDDGEEPPNRGKKRCPKSDEKDDKDSFEPSDSDDGTNDSDRDVKHNDIEIGDRVKVKYGRGKDKKVYEAKVLKIDVDGNLKKRFFVHYTGWNTRYDEWVRKNYIVEILGTCKVKSEGSLKASPLPPNLKKMDRGRPPGVPNNTKPIRKNSTSSTSSRATRSDKKSHQSTPLSSGLEPKKRTRRKSGTLTSAQESDTDGADAMELDDEEADDSSGAITEPSQKEEIFSEDDEKELTKQTSYQEQNKVLFNNENEVDSPRKDGNVKINLLGSESVVKESQKKEQETSNENVIEAVTVKQESNPSILNPVEEVKSPAKLILSPSLTANAKTISSLDISPSSSNPVSLTSCSVSLTKCVPVPQVTSKAALSFEGLIKKTVEENIVDKVVTSASVFHPSNKAADPVEKPSMESKPLLSEVFQPVSAFKSILSTPKKQATTSFETKPVPPKDIVITTPSPIIKPEKKIDIGKKVEVESDSRKVSPIIPKDFSLKPIATEATKETKAIKEVTFKPEKIPETKTFTDFNKAKNDEVKDTFDLLLESTKSFCHNTPKVHAVKDNIFPFTFGSQNLPTLSPALDSESLMQPKESLCRIKPKASETMDVSKMIPGILERLKKDVVSDSKASDSPPPPKQELTFDFLCGSRNIKSLSRSNSSTSLRICESDTNDSNTDSKDLSSKLQPAPTTTSIGDKPTNDTLSKPQTKVKEDLPCKVKDEVVNKPLPSSIAISEVIPVNLPAHSLTNKETSPLPKEEVKISDDKTAASVDSNLPETSLPETIKSEFADSLIAKVSELLRDNPVEQDSSTSNPIDSPALAINTDSAQSLPEDKDISSQESNYTATVVGEMSQFEKDIKFKKEEVVAVKKEDTNSKEVMSQDISEEAVKVEEKPSEKSSSPLIKQETHSEKSIVMDEVDAFSQLCNKEVKKKKLGKKMSKKFGSSETSEKEDGLKLKEGKLKKKRLRIDNSEVDTNKNLDLKFKSKKLKKNKTKKRFSRHSDQFSEFRDDLLTDKLKRREKKRSEKKFLKSEDFKNDILKKKKNKKNRDKLSSDKKTFFEKKTKKKRKSHLEDNQDTDSEKETLPKLVDKKRKKERKKFKVKNTCSSSDEASDSFFKGKGKNLPSTSLLQRDFKSDDPDMSFLLCEENVPASPGEDTSGSSSNDENNAMDLLPDVYPSCSGERNIKHNIDNVLDNTPPTTPSSTESLLSSSPSHERESFSMNYPESTQSGEGESDLFHVNANRSVARGSEEYRAATTLAFAVCKSVSEKPKEDLLQSFGKRPRSDQSPTKRKKKRVQRYSDSTKSPKHKSSYSRLSKVENYCEDSSGTSPGTSNSPPYANVSTLNFSRSLPHRQASFTEGSSRYFYVPLHEKDPEKRIAVLQDKMAALRKRYMTLRAEVVAIDHKRRRARKKVKDSANVSGNVPVQTEDGQSCS